MSGFTHRLTSFVALALGLMVSMVLGYFVTGAEGNVVRILSVVVAMGTFTWSVVRPMTGLYLLVVMAATLDLAKRFLILYDDYSLIDVAIVLSTAPITMVGVLLGCMFRPLLAGHWITRTQTRLVLFSILMAGGAFVLHYLSSKSLKTAVTDSANDGAYVLMLPIVYSLFYDKSQRDVMRFLSFCLAVFTPVALYGCWQFFAGFNDLEVEYLKSGLTQTENNLYEVRPRPFSTLNSITSFSLVMWFGLAVAFYFCFAYRWRGKLSDWLRLGAFLIGMFLSFARGAIVFGLLNLGALYVFRSRRWTRLCYVVGVASFMALVLNAGFIRDNLPVIQSFIPQSESDAGERFLTVSTFSDRLLGYQNVLGNPRSWTLFGKEINPLEEGYRSENYSHDALSQIILTRGIVFTSLLLIAVVGILCWAHGRVHALPGRNSRNFAAFLLSVVVLMLANNVAGYALHIYPVNLFFWLFVGFFYTVVHGSGLPEFPDADEPETDWDEVSSEQPMSGEGFPLAPARGASLTIQRR